MANIDKRTLLLKEYKEGFSEIKNLVDNFEEIEIDSQETFIRERRSILKNQLEVIDSQRINVYNYLRSILAKANSRLKALSDIEVYVNNELEQCDKQEALLLTPEPEQK